MAMNFWEAKRRARRQTALYLLLFASLAFMAAMFLEFALRYYGADEYNPQWPVIGMTFLGLTFLVAAFQYSCFKASGGKFVAESMGARLANTSSSLAERQLLNIVEEVAIASSLPIPAVYIIDAKQINAFAAGISAADAVIAVTQGALDRLSRDEMQAVIAHEFGHISNGDMLIGLRLAAMLMGFYFILYLGLRLLQFSGSSSRSRNEKKGNPILLAALFFVVAGAFTWLFGTLLKAAVSRQREYLADASSVQFTRNPLALAHALQKIQEENINDMPKSGMSYSHLYFDNHSSFSWLFATHPPLQKRIDAILAQK